MLKVIAVPAFEDNYLWLIHNGTHAAAVDPGDANPILAALADSRLALVAILLTHHHGDHIGGVKELIRHFKVPVFGPDDERMAEVTVAVDQGDDIMLPELPLALSVLKVPGHTLSHIAYHAPEQGWLFCGDTLFAGGCGRLFEGTPRQMAESLQKLAVLPDETQVFCAHEYTLSNLRFALEAEPDNSELRARYAREREKRAAGVPTVPTSIGLEKRTNPFLRCVSPSIRRSLEEKNMLTGNDPVDVFAALREWKNNFR